MVGILYKNYSPRNYMNKDLKNALNIQVILKDDTEMINPTIIFRSGQQVDISNYNYLYLPAPFNRYYFIENVTRAQQLVYVECSIDVLNSFKGKIKALSGILARSERNYNLYLDSDIPTTARKQIEQHEFPLSPLTKAFQYILITAGGGD